MFRTGETGLSVAHPPRLLSPLARHLSNIHRDRFHLSALSLQTVLEGIRGKLDEAREISRYMVGLLIFLGLLGTFWGLLQTIGEVADIIGALEVGAEDMRTFFENLKQGLREPLSGMGTAFSSSLLGLGGSLILGFLDIQAGHAQNRFFNEMEEWLTGVTALIEKDAVLEGGGSSLAGTQGFDPFVLTALLEEMKLHNRRMARFMEEAGYRTGEERAPDSGKRDDA
jgi:hypothetical protein